MKFYRWLTVSMLLCCTQIIWAQNCEQCYSCDPCNSYSCGSCPSGMTYSAYVDYLYWVPFRSGIFRSDKPKEGDIFLDHSYTSGYRIGGLMSCNCMDLGVRYTSFDSTSEDSSVFPFSVKYDVEFQDVDIEVGYVFCFDCGDSFFRPFVGGQLVWIDEKLESQSKGTETLKFDDRGYGAYIGAEGKLQIFDCIIPIALRARGRLGLLNSSYKITFSDIQTTRRSSDEPHMTVVSEVFVGLDFSYCGYSCFDINLLIGYELQSYLRDTILSFVQEFPASVPIDDFGLGGLVIRFGVCF